MNHRKIFSIIRIVVLSSLFLTASHIPGTTGAASEIVAAATATTTTSSSLKNPLPILVTAMVHIDPLPTIPDQQQILRQYARHRDGWLWYLNLAAETGLRISAQMTGVYAEACIRQGHAFDFMPCMPGGPHHLGTHLHANIKEPEPYVWKTLPENQYRIPELVRRVFEDNLPWVNRVFEGNGFSSKNNWFFHGSHAVFPGMDEVLFDYSRPGNFPYDNVYLACGALRGRLYLYRGDWLQEPHQKEGCYIKISEVGGIIGEDSLHGPEGMVYGTVRYQKRDFLRVYIEWREMVRRGDSGPVRHFNWMVHPYQLMAGYVASDGRSSRDSIRELVAWLNENFIGKKDESGHIMAQYVAMVDMCRAFEDWERNFPAQARSLQETLKKNEPPRYLPGIPARLETAYYEKEMETRNPLLVGHELKDRANGQALFLMWSEVEEKQPVFLSPTRQHLVHYGDGRIEEAKGLIFAVGIEPVLIEQIEREKSRGKGDGFRTGPR